MAEVLILGGGVAGLSAAWHAGRNGLQAAVFEAKDRPGGLCDHFHAGDFRFDCGAHFGFSNNAPYSRVLAMTEVISHRPRPFNFEAGKWLKHPVQNNLYPLKAEEKVEAIKSFIERPERSENPDYGRWLKEQFGEVIARRYPARYTMKYWTVLAEKLSTEWVGNRLYRPSLDEVLYGAMTEETPQTYYFREMFYPRRGGYRAFIEPLQENLDLWCGKEAVLIDPDKKYVLFNDGSKEYYAHLVSSLPLPELVRILKEVPGKVEEAAETLWATSAALVSVGFNLEQVTEHLWFYIYDSDILPARVHAPYLKSPDNAPKGKSSLQFETYFSRHKPLALTGENLVEHVTDAVERLQLAAKRDIAAIDYRVLPYANVVFDHGMTKRRDHIMEFVRDKGIIPVGRFGEWDYLWTDQSFLSGKKVETLSGML
ncbi:MAG: NAD(P)-binding protein [Bacillota bacterium]